MKKNYEEIDELISKALSEEEARFYKQLDEQNLPQMVSGLFQGKMKWLTILTFAMMPILFGVAVYCCIQFFQVEDLRSMLIWGAGAMLFIMATSFLKLYQMMQMDRNSILREIKRMELQVAILSNKLDKNKA